MKYMLFGNLRKLKIYNWLIDGTNDNMNNEKYI